MEEYSNINKNSHFNLGKLTVADHISPLYDNANIEPVKLFQLFESEKSSITKTIHHEVRHMVQTYINFINGLKNAGLPSSKLLNENISPEGYLKNDKYNYLLDNDDEKNYYGQKRIKHTLRDVEFYTRISDSITEFENLKTKIPQSLVKTFASYFICNITWQEISNDIKKYCNNLPKNTKEPLDYLYNLCQTSNFFYTLKEHQHDKYKKACAIFINKVI